MGAAYSIVPDGNRIWLPLEAYLMIRIFTDLVEQELQDGI